MRVVEGYETFMNHMPWYHFPYMSVIGLYWTTLAREVVSSLILLYFSSPFPLPPQWRSNLMSIRHRLRGRNESGGRYMQTSSRPAVCQQSPFPMFNEEKRYLKVKMTRGHFSESENPTHYCILPLVFFSPLPLPSPLPSPLSQLRFASLFDSHRYVSLLFLLLLLVDTEAH